MIVIQEEHPNYCRDEIAELAEAHVHEINTTRSATQLNYKPNEEVFNILIDAGAVRTVVVRDTLGILVGYGVLVTSPDTTDTDVTMCTCQALYVVPEHRGMTSIKLLNKLEAVAKEVGAECYVCGVKPDADFSKYLLRRNFKLDETMYILKL